MQSPLLLLISISAFFSASALAVPYLGADLSTSNDADSPSSHPHDEELQPVAQLAKREPHSPAYMAWYNRTHHGPSTLLTTTTTTVTSIAITTATVPATPTTTSSAAAVSPPVQSEPKHQAPDPAPGFHPVKTIPKGSASQAYNKTKGSTSQAYNETADYEALMMLDANFNGVTWRKPEKAKQKYGRPNSEEIFSTWGKKVFGFWK